MTIGTSRAGDGVAMRILVEFTVDSRIELVHLLKARMADEGDAVRFASLYLDDIEQEFLKCEGTHPRAEQIIREDKVFWSWHYADGIWAAFTITDVKRRFLGGTVRTIRVFSFRSRPIRP